MYSHCLFCRADLGANDVIEALPIGRRIAFDAAKGRLWVVCPRCAQWNLTPFEERWEAVETAERLYGGTSRRMQGDQVGLAKLAEGLELVRIGRPQRPEFAAWRYGDRFVRRRRNAIVGAVALAGGGGLVALGLPLLGVGAGVAVTATSTLMNVWAVAQARKSYVSGIPHPDGGRMVITKNDRPFVRLVQRAESEGGWGLDVPYQRIVHGEEPWWSSALNLPSAGTARLSGPAARHAAEVLLPGSNPIGARKSLVSDAVHLIEEAGGAEAWLRSAATQTRQWGAQQKWGDTGAINHLPRPVRLALEMAAHEEGERGALEGELSGLEARWREAEEIAAIADDMLLPASVSQFIARARGTARG